MAEDVKIPGVGAEHKKTVLYVGGAAGAYVAFRWYQARKASAAAAAAGPTALPVDTSNTAAAQGATDYTNPDPNAGPSSSNSDAVTTNAEWSTKVEGDLTNIGYDGQTVAAALGLYLSSQPLTLDQANIVRVAWAMDGKPPESSNLSIIPVQTPPTGGGTSTPPPPPPPSGGSSTPPPPPPPPPPPAPSPAPDPHAGQHWQNPQVATLEKGVSLRQYWIWHPSDNYNTLVALNPGLNPNDSQHGGTKQIRTSDGRWVPN